MWRVDLELCRIVAIYIVVSIIWGGPDSQLCWFNRIRLAFYDMPDEATSFRPLGEAHYRPSIV